MTIRANPDEDMVLYGKSAGGRYHIVRTDDAGVVEVGDPVTASDPQAYDQSYSSSYQ